MQTGIPEVLKFKTHCLCVDPKFGKLFLPLLSSLSPHFQQKLKRYKPVYYKAVFAKYYELFVVIIIWRTLGYILRKLKSGCDILA